MKIAAAYIRVSTDDQIEFSPDSQLKKIREYAKSNDFILSDEFIFRDEGISGRTAEKRPEFQRMIALAKKKQFDAIIVWKFSRFARNREDSIVYKSLLRKHGVDVISVSEQLSDDNSSILMEAIYEAMDEYYSANLSQEVKRGLQEKFSRGEIFSTAPYGYSVVNHNFVPNDDADIVRKIFADFISGKKYREIANELNSLNIRSKPFVSKTIKYMICNVTYCGKLRKKTIQDSKDRYYDNAELIDGHFEPIISVETFEQAQTIRKDIENIYCKNARQTAADYMLKGLVRCSSCGATLIQQKNGQLQCHRYARGVCKVSHSIKLDKITGVVIEQIRNDLKTDNFNITIEPVNKPNTAQNDLVYNLIAKEETKLKRIKDAYLNGIDSMEEYKENKQRILKTIDDLKAQVKQEIKPQTDIKKSVKMSLNIVDGSCSESDKNIALRRIIDKIVFDRQNSSIQLFYKAEI